jgi:hypothetical protein
MTDLSARLHAFALMKIHVDSLLFAALLIFGSTLPFSRFYRARKIFIVKVFAFKDIS